jgi:hypothetical protein
MPSHVTHQDQPHPLPRSRFGFWIVAFATVMAFTTVPIPLWSLYAQRDRFSSLTVTVAFAVYALAVALSLDPRAGRRPPARADRRGWLPTTTNVRLTSSNQPLPDKKQPTSA